MESEFQHYFIELKEQETKLGKNPFSNFLQVTDITDEMQDRFCELITDSFARSIYQEKSLIKFWCDVSESKLAFIILLQPTSMGMVFSVFQQRKETN